VGCTFKLPLKLEYFLDPGWPLSS